MIEFISEMTPGDWLLAASLVAASLGAFAGAVWWMSAVYMELRNTRREVKDTSKRLIDANTQWGTESERHWQVHESHRTRLENHEGRLIRLEEHGK